MALEIPVRLVHGLPDAVQVRLAADARRPAALLRECGRREKAQGHDESD
jgi:hypothetical protein